MSQAGKSENFKVCATMSEAVWNRVCEGAGVSSAVAERWLLQIREKYSGPTRFYHNLELLDKKAEFLGDDQPNHLVFAVVFQYFEFDARTNCTETNCKAFRQFCDEAALGDVS